METTIIDQSTVQTNLNQSDSKLLMSYLELGNTAGKSGKPDEAIDYYIKGLQIAKSLQNKPRIQQFSNLILTYI